MKSSTQIKLGVILSYVNIGTQIVVSLLYTPFLIRMLGKGEYGLFALAFSMIGVFSILDLGLGNANIRYTAKYRAEGEKQKESELHGMFFVIYSFIGVLSLILGMLFYYNVEYFFGSKMDVIEISKLKPMFLFVILSMSLSFPISVFNFIIQGYERFIFAKSMALLRIILIPVIAVIALKMGYRSVTIIGTISVMSIMILLTGAFYCFRVLKIKLSFKKFDTKLIREIVGYSFFVFLGVLSTRMNHSSNQFVLGIVSGALSVSVYALTYNLVINFLHLSTAVSSVFLPVITRIPQDASCYKQYDKYFTSIGRLQFYVLGLFYLGFIFLGHQFISLWAGPGFDDSYRVAIVLLTALCIVLTQNTGITILQALKLHRLSSIVFIIMSVFNIALSFILSKRFGAFGSAIALSSCWVLGHGIFLNLYLRFKAKLNIMEFWIQLSKIVPSFIPTIFAGIIITKYYKVESWFSLVVAATILAIVYVLSIVFLSFNKFENDLIIKPLITHTKKHFGKGISILNN